MKHRLSRLLVNLAKVPLVRLLFGGNLRKIILCLCVFAAAALSQTKELTAVFDEANRMYLAQRYDAAINRYESIIKNGYESGELYFNLGNVYYKTGRLQNAILNYERAKKILPSDEDVQFNLQLANFRLADKVEPVPVLFIYEWGERLLSIFPAQTMLTLCYILFLLTLSLFSLFLFAATYQQKRYMLLSGMICAVSLIIAIAVFSVQSYKQSTTEYGIVMADVANIKSAPERTGNDLFVIHSGLKVQVLDNVNKWRKIRLADGKIGWIPEDEVEII